MRTQTYKSLIIFLAGACSLSAQDTPAFPVSSAFDDGEDGWTTPSVTMDWLAEGGNLGGFLYHNDVPGGTSSVFAPAKFLGEWSSLDKVGVLLYDHKVITTGAFRDRLPYFVRISGPSASATWTGPEPGTYSYGDWITLRIPIDEANWQVTMGTWQELLSNVTSLEIRIEHFDNYNYTWRDQNGIDNVVLARRTLPETPVAVVSFKPVVAFWAELGYRYVVEGSEDMQNFTPLHTVVGRGQHVSYTDSRPLDRRQFYRIRIQE